MRRRIIGLIKKRQRDNSAYLRLQVVELYADLGQIKRRLNARDETSAEISDARLEDFEKLNAAYEPPSELARDLIKISTNNSVSNAVKAVLQRLAKKQAGTIIVQRVNAG